jgi:uncharacterized protein YhaN
LRFESITLENYGAFAARSIEPGPGLTIVYGPNEAGKSTFLEAISDFLFTIPPNSARGSLYGYDAMRIGAVIRTKAGERLALRRRKGRGKTLVDETGAAVDDGVLAQLLGSTTRPRFETLFGLDHETLREGGEHLLSAAGDIGRLIVEAGGGLRTLMARLDDIDEEAGKLFSNRRSGDRVFYQALDAFTAADKEGRGAILTREAHDKLRKAHAAAEALLVSLRDGRTQAASRRSALERTVRVSPSLAQHDRIRGQLAAFDDVAHLGPGFSEAVTAALSAKHPASALLDETLQSKAEMDHRLAAMTVDPALIAQEPDVLKLLDGLANVRTQRADRPNRLIELAGSDERLAALRRRLGLGADEDLANHLPSSDALARVQKLVNEILALNPALSAANERIAELQDTKARIHEVIARVERLGQDRPFGVNAADLGAIPARASNLEVRRRQARTAADDVFSRCTALGFDTIEALRAVSCPQPAMLQAEIGARSALEAELVKCGLEITRAEGEATLAAADIVLLQAAGEIPTEAVLRSARTAREAGWAPIRDALLEDNSLPARPQLEGHVSVFEAASDRADDVADRRATEAQRIAALGLAEQQIARAKARIETSRAIEQATTVQRARSTDKFAAAYPSLVALHCDLSSLSTFLEARRQLLEDWRGAEEGQREVERLEGELGPSIALLTTAERRAGLPSTSTLDERTAAAMAAISAHDEAYRGHQAAIKALADLEAGLATETRKQNALDGEFRRWTSAWAPAIATLGAPPDIDPQAAGELVTQWAAAEGVIAARALTQRRLDGMDEDAAELARIARTIAEPIALALPDEEVVAAQMLEARWRENEKARVQRAELEPGLRSLAAQLGKRRDDVDVAVALLRDLGGRAGNMEMGEAELEGLAIRQAERFSVQAALESLEGTLVTAGDALGVDALLDECAGRGIDELKATLASLDAEDQVLVGDYENAIRAEQGLRADLAGREDDTTVGRASVQREAATVQMHEAIERYVELTLAKPLITQAIAKVRAQQQDPIIRRAAELFAVATAGEFTGLEADIDQGGKPVVVGVRASGGQAPVAIMSDGTRDQLFLAFRLASLEAYCAVTEPLPFIADDILVHFDDPRSASTLDLLAKFAETTQVILFTHHASIPQSARELVQRGQASLCNLSLGPVAPT